MVIVGFGDSITKGVFVEDRSYLIQLAERAGAQTINAGMPGQTSTQGLVRLQADVLDRKPDVCVVAFGMNDHVCIAENTPKTPLPAYKSNLCHIIEKTKEAGIVPILCTIHPIIEGNDSEYYYARHPESWYANPKGAQAWIDMYNEAIREIAISWEIALADVAKYWQRQLDNGERIEDLLLTVENFGKDDGVHLTEKGHRLYAECIAEQLP